MVVLRKTLSVFTPNRFLKDWNIFIGIMFCIEVTFKKNFIYFCLIFFFSDIKGANVLVDNNGICKLADFGSAKRICGIYENEGYQSLSGTANWMAPEVIRQTGSGR